LFGYPGLNFIVTGLARSFFAVQGKPFMEAAYCPVPGRNDYRPLFVEKALSWPSFLDISRATVVLILAGQRTEIVKNALESMLPYPQSQSTIIVPPDTRIILALLYTCED